MKLWSVLKAVGKDLGHVGTWIDEGLKMAIPVAAGVDPPLAAVLAGVDAVLATLQSHPNAETLQAIVQAVTTLETIKAASAKTA